MTDIMFVIPLYHFFVLFPKREEEGVWKELHADELIVLPLPLGKNPFAVK
jgi:hypothetical protein